MSSLDRRLRELVGQNKRMREALQRVGADLPSILAGAVEPPVLGNRADPRSFENSEVGHGWTPEREAPPDEPGEAAPPAALPADFDPRDPAQRAAAVLQYTQQLAAGKVRHR